jgi:hypothetical protein
VLTAIEALMSSYPQGRVTVIPTPQEGVEEILVWSGETQLSCILLNDNSVLQLTYLSTGRVPEAEVQATKVLLAEVEGEIRRSCAAAENMKLVSEHCSRIDCQMRSP